MRRIILLLTVAALAAVSMAMAGSALAVSGNTDTDVNKGLAQVRRATAEYHKVSNALADGYQPAEHCVAVPGWVAWATTTSTPPLSATARSIP